MSTRLTSAIVFYVILVPSIGFCGVRMRILYVQLLKKLKSRHHPDYGRLETPSWSSRRQAWKQLLQHGYPKDRELNDIVVSIKRMRFAAMILGVLLLLTPIFI